MGIDLFNSRRDTHEIAKWWKNVNGKTPNSIIMSDIANGIFYFKQVEGNREQIENIGGMLQYSMQTMTIMTRDNIKGLKVNDIIKLRGNCYIVVNIQKMPKDKNYFYGKSASEENYILIRGA